ncbi:MAG TPA: class I lanthipeptide [Bacteroidia bacterium]|jgi:hypothetical protein|nr:class I lanthipeptide [Bacteroidia bacterium]
MKKIKFESKLSLNKEIIAKLNHGQMNQINGGGTILTTLANCGGNPAGTRIGVTCVTAGVSCGCPINSAHSECGC